MLRGMRERHVLRPGAPAVTLASVEETVNGFDHMHTLPLFRNYNFFLFSP